MDELELLARELAGVVPLPDDGRAPVAPVRGEGPNLAQQARRAAAVAEPKHDPNPLSTREPEPVAPRAVLSHMRPGVQLGVYRKLRLGHYAPEARLDLHRLSVAESRHALWRFLGEARRAGLRCVLVLHGRGELSPKPALLKSQVRLWLMELPEVLAFHSAVQRDGGDGALYVLLKKSDEEKQLNRERHGSR